MRREPPTAVRRQLAEEVGFGCPVDGCGSPYLTWHHFDPPWAVEQHHNPAGMVALCRDHHPEADAGAFTTEQLREFKQRGRDRTQALGAQSNWMREELLAVVGGKFYFETPVAVQIRDTPVVWFGRDESGHLLVNLRMPTTSGEPRILMLDNFWITEGADEHEIVCPSSGRLVSARYPNGDYLKIEFRELGSLEELDRRYHTGDFGRMAVQQSGVEFPIATVEITMDIAGTDLSFGPKQTSIAGGTLTGSWMVRNAVGLQIGDPG